MNIDNKIESFIRIQRLKKLALFLIPLIITTIAAFLIVDSQNVGDWEQKEISGVMTSVTSLERETGNRYIIKVRIDTGDIVKIIVERIALYKQGQEIILNQSLNTNTGATKYRYLRAKNT